MAMCKRDMMECGISLLTGAGIGAGIMYLMDPDAGADRRQYLSETAGSALHTAGDKISHAAHHVGDAGRQIGSKMAERVGSLEEAIRTGGSSIAPGLSGRTSEMATGGMGAASVTATVVGCALAGAACMWLFDPRQGRRRRAMIRDRAIGVYNDTSDLFQRTGRYIGDKTRGYAAGAWSMIHSKPVDDQTLTQRVRSQLGHWASNMNGISVEVNQGCVTLSGPVEESERSGVRRVISRIPGVRELVCRFEESGRGEQMNQGTPVL